MESKNWFESKIVWVGIINTLIASLTLAGEFLTKADFSPVAVTVLITGILTIILRVWFTDTEISK